MTLTKGNFSPSFLDTFLVNNSYAPVRKAQNVPLVNVKDDNENFYVDVVAPGVDKNEVKIELNGANLTIQYVHKTEVEEKKAQFVHKEFQPTSFSRSITLPQIADLEKIAAQFTDGVIKILIPKKEIAKPKEARKIEIL